MGRFCARVSGAGPMTRHIRTAAQRAAHRLAGFAVGIMLAGCLGAVPAAGRGVALVIGNSAYGHSPLRNPTVDATSVAAAWAAVRFDTRLILDGTLTSMRTALSAASAAAHAGDLPLLIYFAGH